MRTPLTQALIERLTALWPDRAARIGRAMRGVATGHLQYRRPSKPGDNRIRFLSVAGESMNLAIVEGVEAGLLRVTVELTEDGRALLAQVDAEDDRGN